MKKYPHTGQYGEFIRALRMQHDYKGKDELGNSIYENTTDYPIVNLKGTVKLHGTNASIVKYKDRIETQSRNLVITPTKDNLGFSRFIYEIDVNPLFDRFEFNDYIAIYGEWCGPGIQGGVGISQLKDPIFVIFAIKIDDNWINLPPNVQDNDNRIYNILQFETFEVEVDLNNPELSKNYLIELTLRIEQECPAAKYFGISGIGEGIVFEDENFNRFKSKGDKHSTSNVTTLNAVDLEAIAKIGEFVNLAVTENRLNQGLEYLREQQLDVDIKNTRAFIKWVVGDVLREEHETMIVSGFLDKQVAPAVSKIASKWFRNHLNKLTV